MFIYLNKKAQSTAEYVIVLGLIVGAIIAMQTYVKRGLQGRVRDAVDHTGTTQEIAGANFEFSGDQYEPYYLRSTFDSTRNDVSSEQLLTGGERQKTLTTEHSERTGNQEIVGTWDGEPVNE